VSGVAFAKTKQEVVQVAASSNIKSTLEMICKDFEAKTPYKCNLIAASTGHLYAHIMHGAQYDVLLTSNKPYIQSLMNARKTEGHGFVLAIGRVVLWSADEHMGSVEIQKILQDDNVSLAMANPGATPYGVAAKEILQDYNLWHRMHGNIVFGKTLSKTHKMIVNKKVKMGFVAISQLSQEDRRAKRYWEPEPNSNHPIVYEVISLKSKIPSEPKQAFLEFLQSSDSCEILGKDGYQCQAGYDVG